MDKKAFYRFDGYIVAAIVVVLIAIMIVLTGHLSVDMVFIVAAATMLFITLLVGLSAANPKLWNWILFFINLVILVATWAASTGKVP